MSSVSIFLRDPFNSIYGRFISSWVPQHFALGSVNVSGWATQIRENAAMRCHEVALAKDKDKPDDVVWVRDYWAEFADEPAPPEPQPEVEEAVCAQIRARRDAGRAKYKTTMERTDLTPLQWLQHAQEEALDLAIYLEKLRRELQAKEEKK